MEAQVTVERARLAKMGVMLNPSIMSDHDSGKPTIYAHIYLVAWHPHQGRCRCESTEQSQLAKPIGTHSLSAWWHIPR